jgi:BolA family transcriptional regulator, general stress-responsive regulator
MVSTVVKQVEALLTELYTPTNLVIVDNSWQHAGHTSNTLGGSHLAITLVSTVFTGMPVMQRFKHVHATLKPLMQSHIHALELTLRSPEQVQG